MKYTLLLLLAQVAFAPQAFALIEASTLIRQYDDGMTQVTTPEAGVSATFNGDSMKVSAGWAQDLLTSASADVKTFSSKGKITDTRTEYSGAFETQIPDGTMSVGYIQSDENDYHSKTVSAGASREFNQKNTVVAFSFANGDDQINATKRPDFDKRMHNQTYSLSLTQVLSKLSLIQFIYDFRVENGYLGSPYRRAMLLDTATNTATPHEENHPQTRNRHALATNYNYHANSIDTSFATSYRFYNDSWGVTSHTIEERITKEITKKFSMAVNLRYYTQSQANFYQDYYIDTLGPFYTGNQTLATYASYLIGLRPSYLVTDKMLVFGKFEYFTQDFKNATDLGPSASSLADDKPIEISAIVLGIGLDIKF